MTAETSMPRRVSARRHLAEGLKRMIRTMHGAVLLPVPHVHRLQLLSELSQEIVPILEIPVAGGRRPAIRFLCPSAETLFRAQTLMTKEPETIRWIETFQPGDVLWDIGANVGVYSLYAAIRAGARVLSFEPSAGNYWILNTNIELNALDAWISAYCLALGRQTSLGSFNMADTYLGGACYSFGEKAEFIDYPGLGSQRVIFHQGTIGVSVDEFVRTFDPPLPNHIKIDVDGAEHSILLGARQTLRDDRVRSISVELDESTGRKFEAAMETLRQCGFRVERKGHAPMMDAVSQHIFNYQFVRS